MAAIALRAKAPEFFRAALVVTLVAGAIPAHAEDEPPTRVGRVSEVSGELYLAPQDRPTDWASVAVNYPVAGGDNLWVAPEARAEIDFGSGQLRVSGNTNLQLTELDDERFELFIASGRIILRVRTLAQGDSVLVDTSQGEIRIERPGQYRIEAFPETQQTLLIVRDGEAVIAADGREQRVLPGQTATLSAAEPSQITLENTIASDTFDAWSALRDRRYDDASSARYVSSEMVGASDLASYGTWESSPAYGNIWFPTIVAIGWAPYRFGHWVRIRRWGWTWVDDAPWGFAPFHHGRWMWVSGRWGWCPGSMVGRPVWAPALVAWMGGPGWTYSRTFGSPVYGWVPLGWGDAFRPQWRCSTRCWWALNRPFGVDEPARGPSARLANADVPEAVTWAPSNVVTSGKAVAPHTLRPAAAIASRAPVLSAAPDEPRAHSVAPRPVGAPPPAALLRSREEVQLGRAAPNNAPGPQRGSPLTQASTPNRAAPTAGTPPAQSAPRRALRRPSDAPKTQAYGGVTDGSGAYTGVAPAPGPKLPAVDRGVRIPSAVPVAPPVPRAPQSATLVPEVRPTMPRDVTAHHAPAPGAAGVSPNPAPTGGGNPK